MRNQRLRVLQLIDLYIRGYIPQSAFDVLLLAIRQQDTVAPHPGITG